MRSIAFVTQKGGSGKSTLASSLAVAAFEQGERVCLVDMDPQATLMTWSKTRALDDVPVVVAGAGRLAALLDGLEKKGFTLVVIDTPGSEGAASLAAMRAADLNVIPSRPSVFDLWASAQTRAALKAARSDYVVLLHQCPPAQQSARVDDGVAEFRVTDDGPGIPPQFHDRIFVIFQTLASRDDVESSGIGLAIVKKRIQDNGGEIRVESAPPARGTSFVFTWRVAAP